MNLIFFKPPNSKFYCTYNASQNKLTFSALAARELNLHQSTLIKLAHNQDNSYPIYLFTVDKKDNNTFPIYTSGTVCYTSKIDLNISNPGNTVFDMSFPPYIIDNFETIPHLKFAILSLRT